MTFEVTGATGGGVNVGETVSLGRRCQELIVKAACLEQVREEVLVPVLDYLAHDVDPPVTLRTDSVKLAWEVLRQGAFLCSLVNQVQPGVIAEVTLPIPPLSAGHFCDIGSRQNIAVFIKACKDMFFMTDDQLFVPGDLYREDFNALSKALALVEFFLFKTRVSQRSSMHLSDHDLPDDVMALFDTGRTANEATVAESPPRAESKREKLLAELVASERVYVDDLAQLQKYSEEIKFERLLPPQAWDGIFSNLKQLLNYQHGFMIGLEAELARETPDLGALFVRNEEAFSVYEAFCTNHSQALRMIGEYQSHLNRRKDLLERIGDLSAFLIKPVQRIPRYHLFLRDLLRQSEKEQRGDVDSLRLGSESVQRVAHRINERQREAENETIAADFYQHFSGGSMTADKTGKLVLYAPSLRTRIEGTPKTYRVYVFARRIVMCAEKERMGPFWVKNQVSTNAISFVEETRSDDESDPHEVLVTCNTNDRTVAFSLLFKTEQTCRMWGNGLRTLARLPLLEPVCVARSDEAPVAAVIESNNTEAIAEPQSPQQPPGALRYRVEFHNELYSFATEAVPTYAALCALVREHIAREFACSGKSLAPLPKADCMMLQFGDVDGRFVFMLDDAAVRLASELRPELVDLRVWERQEVRVRVRFHGSLYSFMVDGVETLDELRQCVRETIAEDVRSSGGSLDAVPPADTMRLLFREPDGEWSVLVYDNDLDAALELSGSIVDLKVQ